MNTEHRQKDNCQRKSKSVTGKCHSAILYTTKPTSVALVLNLVPHSARPLPVRETDVAILTNENLTHRQDSTIVFC